jgi:hypothetical protein
MRQIHRTALFIALLSTIPAIVRAQSREEQIATAVLPLPAEMRAGARVMGYGADGKLSVIRDGRGMTCLARDPKQETFHVACYHEGMEPFMARGRSLRAEGVTGAQVDSVRFREVASGKIRMPTLPSALYSLTGGSFDAQSGTVKGSRHLYVVYVPFATSSTVGLPEKPNGGQPWLMFPGTPKAHIMFTASMQ